jgi:hypothetical protein
MKKEEENNIKRKPFGQAMVNDCLVLRESI